MWCVPELDDEYIARMEDILDLLEKAPNAREPVVALDERPVPLRSDVRQGRAARPGEPLRRDSEYVRRGVANVFAIVAPHDGRHLTHATANRKGPAFARALKRISLAYPKARTIHLIVDNLTTHRFKSVLQALGASEATALWSRFKIHYTPRHGSWLNPAEIEISLWSRECAGKRRIESLRELRLETSHWNALANREQRKIKWRFRKGDARSKFGYRRRSTKSVSRH